ncbi:MAG: GAF domain-containing protein [Anaerolineales bacterium]|nr:GAF domain-containing protein [Anaerolineales bacterium]
MAEESPAYRETRLGITLQTIASDVVTALGYVGAMVSTYEVDGNIPVRAFYVDPAVASMEQIRRWQERIAKVINRPVDLLDPTFARVNVHRKEDQNNLSVQAVKKRKPIVSSSLYSLFTPVTPPATKPLLDHVIQSALGVRQVVAVPFFLESSGGTNVEIVGNLFAAKSGEITRQDELVLTAFGRQAAAAIEMERQRLQVLRVARQMSTEIQTRIRQEDEILQQIVNGVVEVMGYMGAMLATYEKEDRSLPLRAVCFDAGLEIDKWEQRILRLMPNPISIAHPDPDRARVYVDDPDYADNLSVQAVKARGPVVSDDLYALFTPFVPAVARPIFKLIQRTTGMSQVIAVPFFLETADNHRLEIVGNLFAATTRPAGFQVEEIELLRAFGHQAAAGIRNARLYREIGQLYTKAEQQRREIEDLYRKSDERRQVAEVFGKMAFSASANVHALRNHLGAFSTHLQLMLMYRDDPERLQPLLASGPRYVERLKEASAILDALHEPWRAQTDRPVDLNQAVSEALKKANDRSNLGQRIHVESCLAEDLPPVRTSYDMFVEAFKILIKNGLEAILEKHGIRGEGGTAVPDTILGVLRVETRALDAETLEVIVQDNGLGIAPDNLGNIFDLHWSTKDAGMGFGLFWLKDYIEGLGGRVWVQSQLGEGTTFRVLLPTATAQS